MKQDNLGAQAFEIQKVLSEFLRVRGKHFIPQDVLEQLDRLRRLLNHVVEDTVTRKPIRGFNYLPGGSDD